MVSDLETELWNDVEEALADAKGMYFDGCHKIYLAMDDGIVKQQIEWGYEHHEPDINLLKHWFDESCPLRFVNAVHTNVENPNAGYEQLIPQFAFDEDDEEDDFYIGR